MDNTAQLLLKFPVVARRNGLELRILGTEIWDDDGKDATTWSYLVREPDGSTWGAFAPSKRTCYRRFYAHAA